LRELGVFTVVITEFHRCHASLDREKNSFYTNC
jgi:hypothetical protein